MFGVWRRGAQSAAEKIELPVAVRTQIVRGAQRGAGRASHGGWLSSSHHRLGRHRVSPVARESHASLRRPAHRSGGGSLIPGATIYDIEREAILRTIEWADGSTTRAADLLGISVRKVQYRLKEYADAASVQPWIDPLTGASPGPAGRIGNA